MTEVVANDLVLLSGRAEGSGEGFSNRSQSAPEHFDQRAPEPEPAGASPITDEDIPF
jgi:single-stranded DNA-binding protein